MDASRADDLRRTLDRDVVEGAVRLLGCTLVYPEGRARIVETEAYRGEDDPGCHAFGRDRMKNMALFGGPGTAYVYRSYGIHQMLNVVALPAGRAAGVLIRAARPKVPVREGVVRERDRALVAETGMDGPGRLTKILGVDAALNGADLLSGTGRVWIEAEEPVREILHGPRIGLSPGKGETTLWRFVATGDEAWASSSRRALRPYFR